MKLRLATVGDAERIAEIYAPIVRGTVISFEEEPPEAEEMARRIEKIVARFPWLVAEFEDGVGGYAYASPHKERAAYRWSTDCSVYVAENRRGKGLGTTLYQTLFECLKRQGFQSVFAGVTLPNEASVRLHESLGFQPIGIYRRVGYKLGAWHDVAWGKLELGNYSSNPLEPVSITEISSPVS